MKNVFRPLRLGIWGEINRRKTYLFPHKLLVLVPDDAVGLDRNGHVELAETARGRRVPVDLITSHLFRRISVSHALDFFEK